MNFQPKIVMFETETEKRREKKPRMSSEFMNHLNAIPQLATVEETRPRRRFIKLKPRLRVYVYREIRRVSVLQQRTPKITRRFLHCRDEGTEKSHKNTKKREAKEMIRNLEEASPEEIEREIAASEEEEGELGVADEAAAPGGTRSRAVDIEMRRRGGGELRLVVEPEEGEEAEREGEEDDQLPAGPENVQRRDLRGLLHRRRSSCKHHEKDMNSRNRADPRTRERQSRPR